MPCRSRRYQSEAQLLAGLLRKDEAAFTYFYQTNYKRMLTQVRYIVRQKETAEDLVQECFIRFRDNVHQYQPEKGNLQAWIMRLCQNYAYSYLANSKKRRHQLSLNDEALGDYFMSQASLKAPALVVPDELTPARLPLHRLKPLYRQVIQLHYLEGLTYEEIAHYLGLPLGTVKTRMYLAKQQLKELLVTRSYPHLLHLAQQGGLRL